jgi:hypothetical protein
VSFSQGMPDSMTSNNNSCLWNMTIETQLLKSMGEDISWIAKNMEHDHIDGGSFI